MTTSRKQDAPVVIGLTMPRRRRAKWIPPLMVIAIVMLLGGLWEGLVFLGLPLPAGDASLHQGHGPLMVLGFLGTLIALERAVALGATWAYLAPAATALGGLAIVVSAPNGVGQALVTLGGVGLLAIFVAVHRIQASVHNTVLASGAVCWIVAGALWLGGWDIPAFVPWLVGFLVLTITGERLELSRLAGSGRTGRRLFIPAAGILFAGLVVSVFNDAAGVRIAGIGMIALAVWLGRYDIARRTVRTHGLTRYMAVALLTGYAWLAAGGVLWVIYGRMSFTDLGTAAHGTAYDAMLHAIFLGFVISMIFAHAPVIVPSVTGRQMPYHPMLYIALALLHLSLLLRVLGGDAFGQTALWRWGGSLNEIALLLFVAMAAFLVIRGPKRSRPALAH